jgi:hypothetical protein
MFYCIFAVLFHIFNNIKLDVLTVLTMLMHIHGGTVTQRMEFL